MQLTCFTWYLHMDRVYVVFFFFSARSPACNTTSVERNIRLRFLSQRNAHLRLTPRFTAQIHWTLIILPHVRLRDEIKQFNIECNYLRLIFKQITEDESKF